MAGIFKFLFYAPKEDESPFNPFCYIALDNNGVKDNYPLLTERLHESEIDGQIDYLIKELEKTRKQAKRRYSDLKKKT
jgi:hypothetical protein